MAFFLNKRLKSLGHNVDPETEMAPESNEPKLEADKEQKIEDLAKEARQEEAAKKGNKKKKVLLALLSLFLILGAGGGALVLVGGGKKKVDAETAKSGKEGEVDKDGQHAKKGNKDETLVGAYKNVFHEIHKKAKELSRADIENHRLANENANLRRWIEEIRYDCNMLDAEKETRVTGLKLSAETGARLGVVLSSIEYRPPSHLLPAQLYTLGVSYFKGGEYEKAAVIFSFLTGLDEEDTYKTINNYLVTGVSWYRVNHYKLSETYFDKVLAFPKQKHNRPSLAQASLWKALVMQRTEKFKEAQNWMLKLVEAHPKSEEASWVNPIGSGNRVPGTVDSQRF